MKNILFLSILLSALSWQCSSTDKEETTASDEPDLIFISNEQWAANKFKLIAPELLAFQKTVEVSGMVDTPPEQKAVVTSLVGGHLKSFSLLPGEYVKKGDPLFSIQNPDLVGLQREYLEVSRQLSYLKSEAKRQKTMSDEQITAEKNYIKAKSDYETAQASYHGLRKELSVLGVNPDRISNSNIQSVVRLYAPISGYVSEVLTTQGAYISPQTELLKIINNDHLHLELNIFEKDATKIHKGQRIEFTIPEMSDKKHYAEVHLIENNVREDRTVGIHAHMLDSHLRLLAGMFVDAKVVMESREKTCLPLEALAEVEGKSYAMQYVKKDKEGYYFKPLLIKLDESSETHSAFTQVLPPQAKFLNKDVFSFL